MWYKVFYLFLKFDLQKSMDIYDLIYKLKDILLIYQLLYYYFYMLFILYIGDLKVWKMYCGFFFIDR